MMTFNFCVFYYFLLPRSKLYILMFTYPPLDSHNGSLIVNSSSILPSWFLNVLSLYPLSILDTLAPEFIYELIHFGGILRYFFVVYKNKFHR